MKLIAIGLFCVLFLLGCSQSKNVPVNRLGQPIISEQYDGQSGEVSFRSGVPRFLTLIQLKSPALLATATVDAQGKTQILDTDRQQVLKEQQDLEAELLKISPDIKVVFRYRMVLNAVAVDAPQSYADEINNLDVEFIEADERFYPPAVFKSTEVLPLSTTRQSAMGSSMNIIGATELHHKQTAPDKNGQKHFIRGQGIRVGVIDSGIDYTHSMLGGSGDEALFSAIDSESDTAFFPNSKVVGGRDFVGTFFSSGSHLYENRIPRPDPNPLDRSGHGTHVAGSIAGVGDGLSTYDGAAPDAELYALKVFGDQSGGTNDTAVIAALEYAADPNEDLQPQDHLHVVNLSLGNSSGKPHSLYNIAIHNLTKGGTLVVVAAGNDGAIAHIVGSPSTSDEALSVAASIDDREELWQFPAVEVRTVDHPQLVEITVEGATTLPIEKAGPVSGSLVYVGLAATDFTPVQIDALRGNIALIDRGEVSFDEKIQRAVSAGAIGVVTINNVDGDAFTMGGEGEFPIPGVMITKALGDVVKQQLQKGMATFQYVSSQKAKKPEYIDTIVSFSSQGPRTIDSKIKPEITAPGYFITSAAMGSGNRATGMSGTSMAAPHVAGLAALLFQARPELVPLEIKSLLMNTSKVIHDRAGSVYPISRQGAGRANVLKAAETDVIVEEGAISLGELQVDSHLTITRTLTIKNSGEVATDLSFTAQGVAEMEFSFSPAQIHLLPQQSSTITVGIQIRPTATTVTELDAFIQVHQEGELVGSVPVMGVVSRLTSIIPTSVSSGVGQQTQVQLQNGSGQEGEAYIFQLLGKDDRKPLVLDPSLSSACDLESVGYRIVQRETGSYFQLATKLFNPINTWNVCDLTLEFDFNNDEQADTEIYGTTTESIAGLAQEPMQGFRSLLFDSQKVRDIIADYRKNLAQQNSNPPGIDFKPALIANEAMWAFDHSTLAITELPLNQWPQDTFKIRVSVSYNDGNIVERDDVLNPQGQEWHSLSLSQVKTVDEVIFVGAQQTTLVTLPGLAHGELWMGYFPRNEFIQTLTGQDSQSTVLEPNHFSIPFFH